MKCSIMTKTHMLLLGAFILVAIGLSGCGGGESTDSAKDGKWDSMKWDQGKWK